MMEGGNRRCKRWGWGLCIVAAWAPSHAQHIPLIPNAPLCPGALGNCYLLAALASVAETPILVQSAFPGSQELNEEGIYCVRFCRDGEYRYVVVDDRLPTKQARGGGAGAATRAPHSIDAPAPPAVDRRQALGLRAFADSSKGRRENRPPANCENP